ncbi:RICIN domain-containing protein [Streptosporangium sp. KLBMP 9127]|nr:RICIN domain-containing protein [Streptosporangium sp. KLBMP 9127]
MNEHMRRIAVAAIAVAAGLSLAAGPASAGITSASWTVKFTNRGSNHCLDSNKKGDVYSIACNDRNYQRWIIEPGLRSGWYFIRNKKTGRYLEERGTGSNGVVTRPLSVKSVNQNWSIGDSRIRSATSLKPTLYDEKSTKDIRLTFGSVNPVQYGQWIQEAA